jgi:hypothetical protein
MPTKTSKPRLAANVIPAFTVSFGWRRVPEPMSFPNGETKTALASVPSMPSQFESTNARSGWSGAPGWIAGSNGPQS